jgi:predicted HTH transcriptional regulator
MNWRDILKQPEGKMLEFKETFPPSGESLMKTCVAFANGAGGEIYIGVSDRDREVAGLNAAQIFEMEERFANWVHTMVEPQLGYDFVVVNVDGRLIIRISITAGSLKPYYLKNRGVEKGTYIRVGSTNRAVSGEGLAELHRQRRNICFDGEIVASLTLEQFNAALLGRYWDMRGIVHSKATPERWIKLGAARRTNGLVKPTVGGALFFCGELPEELSQATVEVTRFQGTTMESIADTKRFSPPIFDQIDEVMKFLHVYVEKAVVRAKVRHESRYAYPMEALREAVVNAVCHRDYAVSGANVRVAIFDDRIEISNPGGLMGGLLVSDLGTGISEMRNRLIGRMLRETGYIEQLGTGVQRMRLACERHGIPPPLFQELGLYFKVIFFRTFSSAGMDEGEWQVLSILEKNGSVSAGELSRLLGIHKNTATYRLNGMMARGKIVRSGKGPATRYRLKGIV